jgi:hypothetical protein
VVSTVRIDPRAPSPAAAQERAQAFRACVLSRASGWPHALPADPEQIADAAALFAARAPSFPVASQDELIGALESGGFAIEALDVALVPGSLPASSASAGSARPATYAQFVAVRR